MDEMNPRNREKGYLLPIIGVILLLLLIGGAVYLFSKQSNSLPASTQSPISDNVTTQTPVATQQQISLEGFKKRQLDVSNKFFQSQDYPQEVVNVSNANLVSMKCTEILTCENPYEFCSYYPEGADVSKPPSTITDQKLLNLIKEANKTTDKQTAMGTLARDVYEVTSCETEDGRQILRYKTGGGGGGIGSVDYIGLANSSNTVTRIASIQEDIAYFGCYQPIQLTKDNILYYKCSGADGSGGGSSIYKIDLINKNSKSIFQCISKWDEATSKPSTTCK